MSVATSKTRLYDLAKELKIDTKRLIEEVRREGVDVSVPSNSISKELADKIRNRYFPKKEQTAPRKVVVVKKARPAVAAPAQQPTHEETEQVAQPAAEPQAAPAQEAAASAPAEQVTEQTPAPA